MTMETVKLTGPQSLVLGGADANGLIFRGQHNDICHELKKLGLVKYDPQPPLYPNDNPNPRTAWRLTEAGRAALRRTR